MRNAHDKTMTGLLLFGSLLTFALLVYAAYAENFGADWYHHQSDYRRQLLARAATERERGAAEHFDVHPKQLYLPDLGRIDRCVTCHVAIDDPTMKDAVQPLTAHPGDTMIHHPKERFGCTVCHRGQGLATTVTDAHGHVPHWPDPMLARESMDQSCPKCHTERSLPGVARYNAAMDLFYTKACLSCHKLRGQGGDVGPDISNAGKLHDAEWHFRHFKDPKSVVETSKMPNPNLSDEESHALVFLMMSLTGKPVPTELLSNPKPTPLETNWADTIDPLAGKGHVGSRICMGCHQGLHPTAVDGWRNSKMSSTYERIRDEPIKDNCLPCHTTGFNPETGHYSEEGVGCEGCHGPGADAVKPALAGKTQEHKDAIRLDANSTLVCARCHNPHVPVGVHAAHYRQQPPRFSQAEGYKPIDSNQQPTISVTNEDRPSARDGTPPE